MPSTDAWADCCGANGDEVPASPDFPAPPSEEPASGAPFLTQPASPACAAMTARPTNARLVIAVIE